MDLVKKLDKQQVLVFKPKYDSTLTMIEVLEVFNQWVDTYGLDTPFSLYDVKSVNLIESVARTPSNEKYQDDTYLLVFDDGASIHTMFLGVTYAYEQNYNVKNIGVYRKHIHPYNQKEFLQELVTDIETRYQNKKEAVVTWAADMEELGNDLVNEHYERGNLLL